MSAAVIFILYVISNGSNLPDLTALASFQSQEACVAAAKEVNSTLGSGQYPKTALCLSSDSLNELADKNKVSQQ